MNSYVPDRETYSEEVVAKVGASRFDSCSGSKFLQNHGSELRDAACAEGQNHVSILSSGDDRVCGFGERRSVAGFIARLRLECG